MCKLVSIKSKSSYINYKITGCFDCPFLDERTYTNKPSEYFCCIKGIDKMSEITKEFVDNIFEFSEKCPLPNS